MQEGLALLLTEIKPASITQHFVMDPRESDNESCDSVLGFNAVKKYVGADVSEGTCYCHPQRLVA